MSKNSVNMKEMIPNLPDDKTGEFQSLPKYWADGRILSLVEYKRLWYIINPKMICFG